MTKALATKRPYVKLKGNLDEALLIDNQNVTLLADQGTTLTRNQNGPIIQIQGTSAVQIDDLQVIGSISGLNTGISVPSNNNVKLSLNHTKIFGNLGNGIVFSGGSLNISRSEISFNPGGGILTGPTPITFDITNSFIYRNGSINSNVGGVNLVPLVGSASRFEFNTVVDNQIKDGTILSGGVLCDQTGFTAPNNIIARNLVNGDPNKTNSNTNGQCMYPTSAVSPAIISLKFVSSDNTPYDYHITIRSSAIGQATTPSSVSIDFDNEPRPPNAQDQGADQHKP